MAILVGQLIEILQKYDRDREVTIHTLKGETIEVNGYFVQRDLNDNAFYLTDLDVVFITIDRYYEIKGEKNGNR